jgi:hypothetical protein
LTLPAFVKASRRLSVSLQRRDDLSHTNIARVPRKGVTAERTAGAADDTRLAERDKKLVEVGLGDLLAGRDLAARDRRLPKTRCQLNRRA